MAEPRYVAKGVALSLGLLTASVKLSAAVASKPRSEANVMVCDTGHAARQIRAPRVCDECGGEVPFQQLKKARPVEGGLVVLDDEDLAELKKDAERFKARASITAHPAEQVALLTGVGDKMYFLHPERGHEAAYATFLALVEAHPELAFVTQWTPRSAVAHFQVFARDGVLMFQERTRAGTLREAPELDLEVDTELVSLAEQMLERAVSDYDPATYADSAAEKIAAIVATKEVVPVAAEETPAAAATVVDLKAALREQLRGSKKKAPAKKAAARKKVPA